MKPERIVITGKWPEIKQWVYDLIADGWTADITGEPDFKFTTAILTR